jgi:hypothetical protein
VTRSFKLIAQTKEQKSALVVLLHKLSSGGRQQARLNARSGRLPPLSTQQTNTHLPVRHFAEVLKLLSGVLDREGYLGGRCSESMGWRERAREEK